MYSETFWRTMLALVNVFSLEGPDINIYIYIYISLPIVSEKSPGPCFEIVGIENANKTKS